MCIKVQSMALALIFAIIVLAGAAVGLAAPATNQPNIPLTYAVPTVPRANQPVNPGGMSPGTNQPTQPTGPGGADQPSNDTTGQTVLPPLETFGGQPLVIKLKYLQAERAKPLFAILIPEDRIRFEPVNNVLVFMAGDAEYDQIKALVAQLDVPPRQVMFEVEVVELNRDDVRNLGVDWGKTTSLPTAPPTTLGSAFRIGLPGKGLNKYEVDIQGTINRQIENNRGRLLASPRIAAVDGQTASILIGDRLAIETVQNYVGVTNPQVTVTYIDVGIKLEITPAVNDDGTITTRIKPEVSNATTTTLAGNPNIRTRQAETVLRVKNGQTIVLGGLIQRQTTHDELRVPLLGSIPLVGSLFRTSRNETIETELVILVTPKIMQDQ